MWRHKVFPLVVILAGCGTLAATPGLKVGDPFPPIAGKGMVKLSGPEIGDTAGRVLLIDFWASWCGPCKASFPVMAKLHREYAARGLTIVAVSVDEKAADAVTFARKLAPPFTTLRDSTQRLVRQAAVPAMPTSYLVGRDGKVRMIHPGFRGESSERELRRDIELLLQESAPPKKP